MEKKKTRVLFIFSDTGGGHRSAAEAIIEALNTEYGDSVETSMVDFFKAAPFPFNKQPEWYGQFVKVPQAWGMTFKLSNGPRRYKLIHAGLHPYVKNSIKKMMDQNESDVIVSVHSLANAAILKELGENRPPYITVVTDLISTHAGWFHYKPDICIVPTKRAYENALASGCSENQVIQIGLPIADKFCQDLGDPKQLKTELGWAVEKHVILLVGGGEGMGPLEATARAINDSGMDVGIAIICGRNTGLQEKLSSQNWGIPIHVYGFVTNMPMLMAAADVLVTKAGPGTIIEAVNAGLPILLYSRLPGQEEGNVDYVVDNDLGAWTPNPKDLITKLHEWLENPEEYRKVQENCKVIARPTAAREIARKVIEMAKVPA